MKNKSLAMGIIELTSIAAGVEVSDLMLKRADVSLERSHPICPGKYLVIVTGEVGSVRDAVEAARDASGEHLVEDRLIPQLADDVLPALTLSSETGDIEALGVIETFSAASCLVAADASVKAAPVRLIEVRLGMGVAGKAFLTMTGEVDALRDAVAAGTEAIRESGGLLNAVVVPGPHTELQERLFLNAGC